MTENWNTILTATDSAPSWQEIVPWGALVAALVAIGTAWCAHVRNRNDRRRDLYSDAYKAALEWEELYYRVRRRDPANPRELVLLFHDAQERINYHTGWISIESPTLGRAYAHLVNNVKRGCHDLMRRAWAEPPCDPKDGLDIPADEHPQVAAAGDQFLIDVRDHLSPRPWRRVALRRRYPKKKGTS